MELLGIILSLLISGVVFGFLGRLAVPGPNPMSVGKTIVVGIGGSFLGTIVGLILGARPDNNIWLFFVLQVLGAAAIVWFLSRRRG
ncbi:MAG: hypothetical protein QOH36_1000 [Actinomycetota bacterium]|jgi:uncharacterized membrane protein YeaQ/YmgE (transglycosylase-associated protein family)|nr:hypothetical protein [Actinomycetota bacterium]MEA2972308.1 hypothetical protein [Actinomycetota bacterium]